VKKNVFITGATGFIGSNLLKNINLQEYHRVYCLGRKETDLIKALSNSSNVTFIKADIADSAQYADALSSCDVVVHLAALTGKAEKQEYFSINSEGTSVLLAECAKHEVKQFIFFSSIATDFTNIEGYHYAHSKIEAEKYVKSSGVPYTILKPTIVIGPGSPILDSLLKLVKAPVVPIFGDGTARIQPVYVDDLIACILRTMKDGLFKNQTLTIAGPEQISMEEFIKVLHKASCEKKFRTIHVPVKHLAKILLYMERRLLAYLPFTAGQLASFTNDGITDVNPCFDCDGETIKNIDEMLRLSLVSARETGRTSEDMKRECAMFTHYLIGREADAYVQEKYIQAHKATRLEADAGLFDSLLIKAANSNAFFLKLADSYTSIFYKNAVLRKKLLLMLAILECCNSTYGDVDRGTEGPVSIMLAQLAQKAFFFFVALIASLVLFAPLKLMTARSKDAKKLF